MSEARCEENVKSTGESPDAGRKMRNYCVYTQTPTNISTSEPAAHKRRPSTLASSQSST